MAITLHCRPLGNGGTFPEWSSQATTRETASPSLDGHRGLVPSITTSVRAPDPWLSPAATPDAATEHERPGVNSRLEKQVFP